MPFRMARPILRTAIDWAIARKGCRTRFAKRVDATRLCSDTLTAGQLTCTLALGVGTHTITATYLGDSTYAAATSAPVTHIVNNASNVALASTGALATASSTWNANFPVSAVNNGDRTGAGFGAGGVWTDGTASVFPDSVTIVFAGSKTINRVVVFSPQDNYSAPIEPTDATTFANLGAVDFTVEGWNGSAWVSLGSVTGNNLVKRSLSFTNFTTDRIRVNVTRTPTTLTRLVEIEAWGVSGP